MPFLRQLQTAAAVAAAISASAVSMAQQLGRPELTPDQRREVERLINDMTIEEKAGQMTQVTLGTISKAFQTETEDHVLDLDKARDVIVNVGVGSVLNGAEGAMDPGVWRELVATLQTMATEDTRLGVPLIYGLDSVHGANYVNGAVIFPHNLTLAASFEPDLAREAARVTALETRAVGVPWNFAPVCDVARAPAWSRVFETFGEDPYLCAVMAAAAVEGMQGDDLAAPTAVAATAKHFLGYGGAATGRDRSPTYAGDIQLHDIYTPPFEAAFEAGVRSVMVNSSEINGVPVHGSRELLTELLREEMGFAGVVVTDWEDVYRLYNRHRVADSEREAVRQAVEAGIDVSMVPYDTRFAEHVVSLVKAGELSESRIDQSVRRILELKMELGLFDQVMPDESALHDIGAQAAKDASLEAARRSITLLRNRGDILPLANGAQILVTGPTADDVVPLHGSWTYAWQGAERGRYPESPTIFDALADRFGKGNVLFEQGASFDEVLNISATVRKARRADVIVLCLGERPSAEKPGDISDLNISDAQIELTTRLAELGKPIIMVLVENRPRIIADIEDTADAIIWTGHPGPFGPRALAEIIAGDVNPSGRLPMTYPSDTNALLTYDHKHIEDRGPDEQPGGGYKPLFPFFAGESYTTFAYEGLTVDASRFSADEAVDVTVTLTNVGDRAGAETVGVFVVDHYASVSPHVRRLKAFDKVDLDPGESRTVRFTLAKDAFTIVGRDATRVFEPGGFTIEVGTLKTDIDLPAID